MRIDKREAFPGGCHLPVHSFRMLEVKKLLLMLSAPTLLVTSAPRRLSGRRTELNVFMKIAMQRRYEIEQSQW